MAEGGRAEGAGLAVRVWTLVSEGATAALLAAVLVAGPWTWPPLESPDPILAASVGLLAAGGIYTSVAAVLRRRQLLRLRRYLKYERVTYGSLGRAIALGVYAASALYSVPEWVSAAAAATLVLSYLNLTIFMIAVVGDMGRRFAGKIQRVDWPLDPMGAGFVAVALAAAVSIVGLVLGGSGGSAGPPGAGDRIWAAGFLASAVVTLPTMGWSISVRGKTPMFTGDNWTAISAMTMLIAAGYVQMGVGHLTPCCRDLFILPGVILTVVGRAMGVLATRRWASPRYSPKIFPAEEAPSRGPPGIEGRATLLELPVSGYEEFVLSLLRSHPADLILLLSRPGSRLPPAALELPNLFVGYLSTKHIPYPRLVGESEREFELNPDTESILNLIDRLRKAHLGPRMLIVMDSAPDLIMLVGIRNAYTLIRTVVDDAAAHGDFVLILNFPEALEERDNNVLRTLATEVERTSL